MSCTFYVQTDKLEYLQFGWNSSKEIHLKLTKGWNQLLPWQLLELPIFEQLIWNLNVRLAKTFHIKDNQKLLPHQKQYNKRVKENEVAEAVGISEESAKVLALRIRDAKVPRKMAGCRICWVQIKNNWANDFRSNLLTNSKGSNPFHAAIYHHGWDFCAPLHT